MKQAWLKNRYAIVGVGMTPQGKVPGRSAASFHVEACINAMQDAGLGRDAIDGLLLYRHFAPLDGDIDTTAFTVAEQLGMRPTALSQEAYCTRTWLTHAVGLLETGVCNYVLVSYGDNGRSFRRAFVNELDHGRPTDELAAYGDFSTMAKYAMIARSAMHAYGTGPHIWRNIAVAQRAFANLNERASMYGKALSNQDYDASPYIVEPFRLLDATPVTDGGRALLLTTMERARDLRSRPVALLGFGQANMPAAPSRMTFEDSQYAAKTACMAALSMSGISLEEIDCCEIYDCFTYTVEATLRDYGFFKPDEAEAFLSAARIGPGGALPVNTSGGMLSEGYFMGLTPVTEAVLQLRGACGARQLGTLPGTKKPERILCSDNGGVFQSHCTIVLGGT